MSDGTYDPSRFDSTGGRRRDAEVDRAIERFRREVADWAFGGPLIGEAQSDTQVLDQVLDFQRDALRRALEERAIPADRIEYLLADMSAELDDSGETIYVYADPEALRLVEARAPVRYNPGQAPV